MIPGKTARQKFKIGDSVIQTAAWASWNKYNKIPVVCKTGTVAGFVKGRRDLVRVILTGHKMPGTYRSDFLEAMPVSAATSQVPAVTGHTLEAAVKAGRMLIKSPHTNSDHAVVLSDGYNKAGTVWQRKGLLYTALRFLRNVFRKKT